MNNYIPIELKGFDEKGLDSFKGKNHLFEISEKAISEKWNLAS